MILLIATMNVEPENQSSYEKIMSELSATVLEREPGVSFYQLGRSKVDADTYRMIERYENKEVFDAHLKSAWFQEAWPKFSALVAGEPVLEMLEAIE